MRTLIACLLLTAAIASAQSNSDAGTLLHKTADLYRNATSFRAELESNLRSPLFPNPVPSRPQKIWWRKDGHYRLDYPAAMGREAQTWVWDGKTFLDIKPALHLASRSTSATPVLGIMGVSLFALDQEVLSVQTTRQENIQSGTAAHDCAVLDVNYRFKNPPAYKTQTTLWIETATGLLWRADSKSNAQPFGMPMENAETLNFISQELNENVDAQLVPPSTQPLTVFDQIVHTTPRALYPGTPAPAWTLRSLAGTPINSSSLNGHVRALIFFTTWSDASRLVLPRLIYILRLFQDQGVLTLALNAGESADHVRNFLNSIHFGCPVLLTDDAPDVMRQYVIQSVPTLVLIGKDNKVANIMSATSSLDPDVAAEAVSKLLYQPQ